MHDNGRSGGGRLKACPTIEFSHGGFALPDSDGAVIGRSHNATTVSGPGNLVDRTAMLAEQPAGQARGLQFIGMLKRKTVASRLGKRRCDRKHQQVAIAAVAKDQKRSVRRNRNSRGRVVVVARQSQLSQSFGLCVGSTLFRDSVGKDIGRLAAACAGKDQRTGIRQESEITNVASLTGWSSEAIRKKVPGHSTSPTPKTGGSWWEQQ